SGRVGSEGPQRSVGHGRTLCLMLPPGPPLHKPHASIWHTKCRMRISSHEDVLSVPGVEITRGEAMASGDKSKYTDKQKRKAEHIAEGYEDRGVSKEEARRRAWATVNKESGGGNLSGSGRGQPDTHASSQKGGRKGGAALAARSPAARSATAKNAAETRKRN